MIEQPFYQVLVEDEEIIIKLNKQFVDQATLENILDYLKARKYKKKKPTD
ncbi:hypothetical protein [Aphanothece hegewaldii]|nr:hypothetical protein [Aphanothece hegewaldii]